MKVIVGAPANGLVLARAIRDFLSKDPRVEVVLDMLDAEAGYPKVGRTVAEAIARGEADRAIVVCGTGIGVALSAATVSGVRAAPAHDLLSVIGAVENYDAQILCMGQKVIAPEAAVCLVDAWLDATHDRQSAYGALLEDLKRIDQSN